MDIFNIIGIYQLHQRKWYNFDTIILDIDFTLHKTNTIIFEIKIAYVSNLAHACKGILFSYNKIVYLTKNEKVSFFQTINEVNSSHKYI